MHEAMHAAVHQAMHEAMHQNMHQAMQQAMHPNMHQAMHETTHPGIHTLERKLALEAKIKSQISRYDHSSRGEHLISDGSRKAFTSEVSPASPSTLIIFSFVSSLRRVIVEDRKTGARSSKDISDRSLQPGSVRRLPIKMHL